MTVVDERFAVREFGSATAALGRQLVETIQTHLPVGAEEARARAIRLLKLDLKEQMKQLDRTLSNLTQLYLQLRSLASSDVLKDDLLACIRQCLPGEQ